MSTKQVEGTFEGKLETLTLTELRVEQVTMEMIGAFVCTATSTVGHSDAKTQLHGEGDSFGLTGESFVLEILIISNTKFSVHEADMKGTVHFFSLASKGKAVFFFFKNDEASCAHSVK